MCPALGMSESGTLIIRYRGLVRDNGDQGPATALQFHHLQLLFLPCMSSAQHCSHTQLIGWWLDCFDNICKLRQPSSNSGARDRSSNPSVALDTGRFKVLMSSFLQRKWILRRLSRTVLSVYRAHPGHHYKRFCVVMGKTSDLRSRDLG